MCTAVVIDGVSVSYHLKSRHGWIRRNKLRWALADVSVSVEQGEMLGIMGANGSGKTTLLRCIVGVFRPTRGSVSVRGTVSSVVDLVAGAERDLTGDENLILRGVLLGLSRAEVIRRRDEIVAFSGLGEVVMASPLFTLSAGMILRLATSVALHVRPEVFVLDEVLAVGDEEFRRACIRRVDDLRLGGTAVIVASHDRSVLATCDRVLVLDGGRPIFLGDPDDAWQRYSTTSSR